MHLITVRFEKVRIKKIGTMNGTVIVCSLWMLNGQITYLFEEFSSLYCALCVCFGAIQNSVPTFIAQRSQTFFLIQKENPGLNSILMVLGCIHSKRIDIRNNFREEEKKLK